MNIFIGIGRLTRDPEVRENGELRIARYTLAVDRRFKREGQPTADFINCVAFGHSAEFAEKYFAKGMRVAVNGRIQTGSYDHKDGYKVYTTDIIVDNQEFADSKGSSGGAGAAPQEPDMNIPDDADEEMPF